MLNYIPEMWNFSFHQAPAMAMKLILRPWKESYSPDFKERIEGMS